jgi:hypothetical protein
MLPKFISQQVTLLIHFEEQQIGELLDVIAVAHAVVAQNVAIIPQLLY